MGVARKLRRSQLVRAGMKDQVLLSVANMVQSHEQTIQQIVAALERSGIQIGESKSESGLVILPPGSRVKQ
jgi:hypothetical protein